MGVEKPMTDLGPKLAPTVKRRRGMALPLVILLVIVGFVFVGVGAYVVRNLFWSSQGVVIESKLYNAAQSGIEWGMGQIWKNKDNIEADLITIPSGHDVTFLQVRQDNTAEGFGEDMYLALDDLPETESGITLTVRLLDCNYSLAPGVTVSDLPPRVLAGTGSGGTGTPTIPPGTSVIIDPSHFLPLGGGVTSHSFVIRSRATGFGRSTELESMVVVEK
jgi:hypothetical protein